jgi:hypothetical protein
MARDTWMQRVTFGLMLSTAIGCGDSTDQRRSQPGVTSQPSFRPAGADAVPPRSERYALLIGIGRYPRPEDSLPGPPSDVREIRDLLISRFGFSADHIVTITDTFATRDSIISALKRHLGRAGSRGTAVFYFSGHGLSLDRNYSVQDTERRGADQALHVWGANGKSSFVLDDELGVLMGRLTALKRLVIVESCFSGSITQMLLDVPNLMREKKRSAARRGPVPTFVSERGNFGGQRDPDFEIPTRFESDVTSPVPSRPTSSPTRSDLSDITGQLLFSATTDGTQSVSGQDWPSVGESHGVFTYYLGRALRTAPATRTMQQLFRDIHSAVSGSDVCVTYTMCQSPQMRGSDSTLTLEAVLGSTPDD